ncbi:FecR family protein [Olivibacter domesticus]|uniref:FecR family protein n=1 Tax=Olivibacter domesticus TaxID=407022 RepID=A0A1H7XXW1_OLID1|nr:FecR family protein [Olivibacter domesticus]
MHQRLKYLYHRFLKGNCTDVEYQELIALMDFLKDDPVLHELLDESWPILIENESTLPIDRAAAIYQRIVKEPQLKHRMFHKWKLYAAASLLLVAIGTIFYFYTDNLLNRSQTYSKNASIEDVEPGTTKAILTLASGKKIDLNNAAIDMQEAQSNLRIRKPNAGSVTLSLSEYANNNLQNEVEWNTITTPKGGMFNIVLPDSSQVFLNASSSISFPTNFAQHEREIKLTGEAYFEVERHKDIKGNSNVPFIVHVGSQLIEVLGTKFNVAAYTETPSIVTTLLSGAVKVTMGQGKEQSKDAVILKPGEQSRANKNSHKITVHEADIEESMAWKDGYFLFNNEPLKQIMEKITRWYNVEVSYEGNVDSIRFLGIYDRSKSLRKLLKDLEQTGKVHFDLIPDENTTKGRRVIVTAR